MEEKDIVSALLKLKHSEEQKIIYARLVSEEESIDICTFYYKHINFDINFVPDDNCWYIITKVKMMINETEAQSNVRLPLKNNSFLSLYEDHPLIDEKFKKYFLPKKRIKVYNFKFFNTKQTKSYKQIITEALNKNGSMSLNEIYRYFEVFYNFSYADSMTWKNSIRHNLSINKEFIKVSDEKGSQWTLNKEISNRNAFDSFYKNPSERINEENSYNIITNKIHPINKSPFIAKYINEPFYRKTYFDRREPISFSNPEGNKRRRIVNERNEVIEQKMNQSFTEKTKENVKFSLENQRNSIIFDVSESTDHNEGSNLSEESSDESSSVLWKSRRNRKNKK